jgi:hypothetical protein
MTNKRKLAIAGLTAAFLLYVGSYAVLSSGGQFVPGGWGLGWVKHYVWAPRGFVAGPAGIEQRRALQVIFLPLWLVDMHFVHTSDKAYSEDYPVNTVLDDQLSKRLEEWEQNQAVQRTGASRSAPDTNHASPPAGSRR